MRIKREQSFAVCVALFLTMASIGDALAGDPSNLVSLADLDTAVVSGYERLTNDYMAVYPPGPFRFNVDGGFFTFSEDGELATNICLLQPATVFGVPIWKMTVLEDQETPRSWLFAGGNGYVFRTNAVPSGFDAQAWVRATHGTPPTAVQGDALAEWYANRDRSRLMLQMTLVNSNDWPTLQAAMQAAATNVPGTDPTQPTMPPDTNGVAFAGIKGFREIDCSFGIWIYSPIDNLAVDVFTRATMESNTPWQLLGTLQAKSPFTLWQAPPGADSSAFYYAARADIDSDGDGIPDDREILLFHTDPNLADSDGDGLSDWAEIYVCGTDPNNASSCGDGLGDGWKVANGLNPNLRDTDGDGLDDVEEVAGWTVPFGWGSGQYGESAFQASLTNVVAAVSAGAFHNLALLSDGHVAAWGDNTFGQCAVPADVTNAIAVSAGGGHNLDVPGWKDGGHSMALLADGTVRVWGWNGEGETDVPSFVATNTVTAIAAGGFHCAAVLSNGTVQVWGDNSCQQISTMPTNLDNVASVAAGDSFTLALRRDGSLVAWGISDFGQTNVPPDLGTNVLAVAAGAHHVVALLRGGSVRCWGDGASGQTNAPAGLTNVAAVAAGTKHSVALLATGQVVCWGANDWQQCAMPVCVTNFPVLAISAGGTHNLVLAHIYTDASNPDTDGDGLTDGDELREHLTNPCDADTDHDGTPDAREIALALDPNVPNAGTDSDGDGVSDAIETAMGSNPNNANSVPDLSDVVTVDISLADADYFVSGGGDDGWNLLFSGKLYQGGGVQTLNSAVLLSNVSSLSQIAAQTFCIPLGQTITCTLQRVEVGQYNYTDEYAVQFRPSGGNSRLWIPRTDNSALSASLPWVNETTPPVVSGIHWTFDLPKLRIAVMKVNHNASQTVELEASQKQTPGAFVPLNSDDDNYNGVPDMDEWMVEGEDDLLKVVVHPLQPTIPGAMFTLTTASSGVKLWDADPRKNVAISPTDQFDARYEYVFWVEGVKPFTKNDIKVNLVAGVSVPNCDRVRVSVFNWLGPLNVPGYGRYPYYANAMVSGNHWLSPDKGTLVSTSGTCANILWNNEAETGKAIYQVNDNYIWDLNVNIVQIVIGEMSMAIVDTPSQAPDKTKIEATEFDPYTGGAHAVEAKATVTSIMGKNERGVKYIQMGFVQNLVVTAQKSIYGLGTTWARANVSTLQQTAPYLDYATANDVQGSISVISPWYNVVLDANQYWVCFDPTANMPNTTVKFGICDRPSAKGGDGALTKTYSGQTLALNTFDIRYDFQVYFAVRTKDTSGLQSAHCDQMYVQRAKATWRFDGSGSIDQSGYWTKTGNNTKTDFGEVQNGNLVPQTSGPRFNAYLPNASWNLLPAQ